ncbi:unnamed protein product [Rhizophagus irregularis]|nr:unnamed protein product [Rhizophagus irregularis]CAB5390366.1 unnamed protein product [Rhizophagus irregularis]
MSNWFIIEEHPESDDNETKVQMLKILSNYLLSDVYCFCKEFDFDLQDGLIIEGQSNKRSYFDDDDKDLAYNSNKKVNSNNNEEIQNHEIGYQYTQRNYATKLFKH